VKKIACHVVAKLLPTACAASVGLAILLTISPTASAETPSLKDTFKDSFLVGAALNPAPSRRHASQGAIQRDHSRKRFEMGASSPATGQLQF
jgi:hypothetical protein